MRQPKQTLSANDNAPIRPGPLRLTQRSAMRPRPSSSSDKIIADHRKNSALAWVTPIVALLMAGYGVFIDAPFESLIWPAALIAALLAWTAILAEPSSRLRNICAVLLIGAVVVSLSSFLASHGFSLMAVEMALLTSTIALLVGWSFGSRPAVMLSALAALAYLVSLFPELGVFTGLIDGFSHIGIALIPALLLGQAGLGQYLRSKSILMVVLIASYIWVFASATNMPLTALAGIGFALAAAQYCLGKAWSAQGAFGARLHVSFAAPVALITAIYIQTQWLSDSGGQAVAFWPPNQFWWAAFGGAMFILFISSLMRYKSSQISLIGIFVISVAALALPLATAKPDWVYMAFDYLPGLNAIPGLGLVIGAVIIAFGLIWIVSGLRDGQLLTILYGAGAIGAQTYILYQPDRLNMDFGVIFIVSLICALCIGGLIAGSHSEHSLPREHHA